MGQAGPALRKEAAAAAPMPRSAGDVVGRDAAPVRPTARTWLEVEDEDATWLARKLVHERPRWAGVVIPAFFVHLFWWSYMLNNPEHWALFGERDGAVAGYWATITMVFGSLVAGATSVGGGAVAFPVMTLVLSVPPMVARDFSLLIQTVGMVAASFTIVYQRIAVDWK